MRPALSAIASPILLTLKDVLSDFPGRRLGSCRARMEVPGEDTSLSKRARTFDYDYLVSLPPILILNPPLHLPSGEDLGALHDRPAKARVHDDLAHRAKSMQVHEIGVHPLTARAKAACPPVNPDGSRTLLTRNPRVSSVAHWKLTRPEAQRASRPVSLRVKRLEILLLVNVE